MGILSIVGTIFKLLFLWLSTKVEKDVELKKKKENAVKEVSNGIKEKDSSKITAGFDSLNR